MISEHIRRQGVELLVGETVNEIYTSPVGRVSGVSTESGARFDCEILGVTAGVRPAVDWLREMETPPDIGRGIIVSADFRTSLKNVWAAGDAAEIHRPGQKPLVEQIWYSAKRHGELAALSMLGDGVAYAPPVFYNSSKFFEIEYTTAGRSTGPPDPGSAGGRSLPEGSRSFYSRVPGREVSMRIVEREGAVIGFNMLGSRWDHTFFERWIEERRSLDYVVERLHEAQFDVEYGRQSLATLRDDYRRWKNGARESG